MANTPASTSTSATGMKDEYGIPIPEEDAISITFINPVNAGQTMELLANVGEYSNSIGDFTSINMVKDYFVPSNGLTIEIEDDRIYSLFAFIQRGWKIQVTINDNPNMIGFVFNTRVTATRDGGTKLVIECKDLLEYMAQGTVPPNMGPSPTTGQSSPVNFHFPPTATLSQCLNTVAGAFSTATSQPVSVITDDSNSISVATGFNTGLATRGKTPASQVKSFSKSQLHLTTPIKGESYLAYIVRLAKLAGCNPKMSNANDYEIICKPPTYDRSSAPPFNLYHYLTAPNNAANNVLSYGYFFNEDYQYSEVIVEANTTGDNKFYQSTLKGIAVNELTGFPFVPSLTGNDVATVPQALANIPAIPSVVSFIGALTNNKLGSGYVFSPFNTQLYNQRGSMPIDISTQVNMPYYTVSNSAHTQDEVTYAARKILAEQQDKYVEAVFRVKGWKDNSTAAIWQPDMMVTITEEIFSPGSPVTFPMWIRKVNFIKSRTEGTITEITCTLPYTHFFIATP
jgi:hypothetical protein